MRFRCVICWVKMTLPLNCAILPTFDVGFGVAPTFTHASDTPISQLANLPQAISFFNNRYRVGLPVGSVYGSPFFLYNVVPLGKPL